MQTNDKHQLGEKKTHTHTTVLSHEQFNENNKRIEFHFFMLTGAVIFFLFSSTVHIYAFLRTCPGKRQRNNNKNNKNNEKSNINW